MMANKIKDVFNAVQHSTSCHQKYLKILLKHYNDVSFKSFFGTFMECLDTYFQEEVIVNNKRVERSLLFAANFCIQLVEEDMKNNPQNAEDGEIHTHPFLIKVVHLVLKYNQVAAMEVRFHTCHFIVLLFKNIENNMCLDAALCDDIQTRMIDRIHDIKYQIRLIAITALTRLQDPCNTDCPVIKAFLICLQDSMAKIRKEALKQIAPCQLTLTKIIERVRDIDHTVRCAAFHKCSSINPKVFKIADRQSIVVCGFSETVVSVKNVFLELLLPKWLTVYDGDFLRLLSALKLDADELDFKNTTFITKHLLVEFFRNHPVNDIINVLPLTEDKLLPMEKTNSEVAAYWFRIIDYVQKVKELEEYLDMIMPEMSPLCAFIKKVISEKTAKSLNLWEYLEFQHLLARLFEIAALGDLADEVGRVALKELIVETLLEQKLDSRTVSVMVKILWELNPVIETLSTELCEIVSNIRCPSLPQSQVSNDDRAFMTAKLKMQINILTDDQETAVTKKEFIKASSIQKELDELKKQLAALSAPAPQRSGIAVEASADTLGRCLDILISVLELPQLKSVPDSLRMFKQECVEDLLKPTNENYKKALQFMVLCAIVDKEIAFDCIKHFITPVAVYRIIPEYNKDILMLSVGAITDFLRIYGNAILSKDDECNSQKSRSKRLYQTDGMQDIETMSIDNLSAVDIVDIMVDILDDDNEEVRERAGLSLIKLLLNNIVVSPSVVARIILKWFNPLTEKQDPSLQKHIGLAILEYAQNVKGSEEVLEKAVIPILTSLANAPNTSPLADVDLDNVLRFLAAITSINNHNKLVDVHKNLSHSILYKISLNPEKNTTYIFVRMLLKLRLPFDNAAVIAEFRTQVESLLEVLKDRAILRNLRKYLQKLSGSNVTDINITENDPNRASMPQGNSHEEIVTDVSIPETPTSELEEGSTNSATVTREKRKLSNKAASENFQQPNGEARKRSKHYDKSTSKNDDKKMGRKRTTGQHVKPMKNGALEPMLENRRSTRTNTLKNELSAVTETPTTTRSKSPLSNNVTEHSEDTETARTTRSRASLPVASSNNKSVKRRKQRGRTRHSVTAMGSVAFDNTMLYTIVEQSPQRKSSDMIETTPAASSPNLSDSSNRSNLKTIISETSSESDVPTKSNMRGKTRKKRMRV